MKSDFSKCRFTASFDIPSSEEFGGRTPVKFEGDCLDFSREVFENYSSKTQVENFSGRVELVGAKKIECYNLNSSKDVKLEDIRTVFSELSSYCYSGWADRCLSSLPRGLSSKSPVVISRDDDIKL